MIFIIEIGVYLFSEVNNEEKNVPIVNFERPRKRGFLEESSATFAIPATVLLGASASLHDYVKFYGKHSFGIVPLFTCLPHDMVVQSTGFAKNSVPTNSPNHKLFHHR